MSGQSGDSVTLVLLHGLGANCHVWDGVAELLGAGGTAVLAPDFRGHGAAPWSGHYSFGAMAADVAEVLQRDYGGRPYAVVGHSMGGAVGLALASGWFGPPPTQVATVGVKLRWSDEELSRVDGLAARPPRMFEDRDGAVEWFMKLSGLFGVFAPDDPRLAATIDAGVVADPASGAVGADSPWRTTQDPATVGVGPPDMTGLLPAAKCPLAMALGEFDPLVAPDHHDDLADAATNPHAAGAAAPHVFSGLGHNAMVEDPRAVAAWLATLPAFAETS
ncbi:alpha/beta fold hydrolase [Candidatus Poriferisodalis sp.]|uniref:alpha/beta fold hydrolase n=1 Tax=Candidatus Poriferisodalis sp. TaxID=3101277 RepID=UPI003D128900